MEWMALACLRVYELTGDTDYYDALMKMWDHIKGAKNGYKGQGGLAWKTDLPASVNVVFQWPRMSACNEIIPAHCERSQGRDGKQKQNIT